MKLTLLNRNRQAIEEHSCDHFRIGKAVIHSRPLECFILITNGRETYLNYRYYKLLEVSN